MYCVLKWIFVPELFGKVLFFLNDRATTEIYTLSLHDALPIFEVARGHPEDVPPLRALLREPVVDGQADRKSTRLNSSHANISYAVFCFQKGWPRRIGQKGRGIRRGAGRGRCWQTDL